MAAVPAVPTPFSGPSLALAAPSFDLLTGAELSRSSAEDLLDLAVRLKREPGAHARALAGKTVVLLFEKPSLRTRVTFEVAVTRLGGHALYFDHQQQRIGEREPVKDYGKNLERWVDAIVARVYRHGVLEELASETSVPVVNALSDAAHPCQALADYMTLRERFGSLEGLRLAYVGDGNNVCASLMLLGAALGVRVTVVTPRGAEPSAAATEAACVAAVRGGGSVEITRDLSAAREADAVYTDAWVSMGCADSPERRGRFEPYRVTEAVMDAAAAGAVFMHCLPAHRGEEVEAAVIDGLRSLVYDQAENRLHTQAALLLALMGPGVRGGVQRPVPHAMLLAD